MSAKHCGLDFGTSNSTLGIVDDTGVPCLLPLEEGKVTLPSAIFFSFEDKAIHFGRQALSQYVAGVEGRMMRSLKSVLGTSLMNDVTRVQARRMEFGEIIGLFLAHVRNQSTSAAGAKVTQVVVGRPVHFVDDDPTADAQAQNQLETIVRAQGFEQVEFQYEPIAAALDYEQRVTSEELALIVDIGGGTSDFSVVRVSPHRANLPDRHGDILSTAGIHIGGTDFDRLFSLAEVMPHLGYQTETADRKRVLPSAPFYDLATWHRINRLYTPQTLAELRQTRREALLPERVDRMVAIVEDRQGHRLASAVEDAKIALTELEETTLAFDARAAELKVPVKRDDLGAALKTSLARIAGTIAQTISMAGLKPDEIETVMLTGGSTQIPAVMGMLAQSLPHARFVANDAFGSVGLGLALDAARKFGSGPNQ